MKYDEVYEILLEIEDMDDVQYNKLVDVYGEDLVRNVIKKFIQEDRDNLEKFSKYVSKLSLNLDGSLELISMFDYYTNDISELDTISDDEKEKLLNDIVLIINDLNILFNHVLCDDNIFGKGRKPWINDKVEYCLNNCSDKEILMRINKLYDMYITKRNKFMEGYLKFVISIAADYVRDGGLPIIELIQYGNLGLIRAVETYNPKFNTKFTTYAYDWVNQSITYNNKKVMYVVRKPMHMFEHNIKRIRVINVLAQELGREPSNREIAEYMGISLDEVKIISGAFLESFSLDEPIETTIDGTSITKKDCIIDDSVDVEDYVIKSRLSKELNDCIAEYLTERQQLVLKCRYVDCMKLSEIASMLGVRYQRVGQIHDDALDKLRKKIRVKKMESYL